MARWYRSQITSFQYRSFRLLWLGVLTSSLGMWMEQVALGWLVLALTDSAFMLGVVGAARMAPFLFVGIPAGALADRMDRTLFIRILHLGIAGVAFLIAVLIASGEITAWQLVALDLVSGVLRAASIPVRQALVYDIVGRGNSLNGLAMISLSQRVAGVMGSLFAGGITVALGAEAAYVGMGIAYLFSVAALMLLRDPGQAAPTQHAPLMENLVGGVRLLRENRTLSGLVAITAAMEALGFSHQQMLPIFARDVFQVGAGGLGVMMAVRAGGGIVGIAAIGGVDSAGSKGKLMMGTLGFGGLALTAFGVTPVYWPALLMLAAASALMSMAGILGQTLMQQVVANEERGRAMGAWTLGIGFGPVGSLELGAIARLLGAPVGLVINGIALAVFALIVATTPVLRKV